MKSLKNPQKNLGLPQHNLKQDEPMRWNSSLYLIQSIVEQKMAIAAYGTDGSIPVLIASQLDIAAKVINILKPIEEITKNISAEATSISQVIPLVRALSKVLEEEVEDTGIHSMKSKMLSWLCLCSRFDDVEDQDFLVLATLLDPQYKDRFFSSRSSHQFCKSLLVGEYLHTIEPAAKRVASDVEEEECSISKLWGCLSEILQESDHRSRSAPTEGPTSGECVEASEPEVDQCYIARFQERKPF